MALSGNPAGLLFAASGGLGFCKNTGCQIGSAILGFAGELTEFGGVGNGGSIGGGLGFAVDLPGSDFSSLSSPAIYLGLKAAQVADQLNRLTNVIYNETAGLRGPLFDARVAIGYVGMNREATGVPLGRGTASTTLTVNEATAIQNGVPSAVQAYNESSTAAQHVLSNPKGDPTGGAQHFFQYAPGVNQPIPRWAQGTPRLTFGPFRNVAGGGDVPKGASVYIQVFP